MVEQQIQQAVEFSSTPPAIKPKLRLGKREISPEEAIEALQTAIAKTLTDPEDLATFQIRRGVTFIADPRTKGPMLECFLRDHVHLVPVAVVSGVIERGTMDNFVIGLLDRLRDRFFYEPKTYNRMEVLCECLYEMRDLLPEGIPECHEFPENSSAQLRRQIDLIRQKVKERVKTAKVIAGTQR